jgi:DNA-directed RNA polymerase specialized sigma24 family protein
VASVLSSAGAALEDSAPGDRAAWSRFYQDWFPSTLAMARAIGRRDDSFAFDVAQESLLRARRAPGPPPGSPALIRWLRRIVRTTVIDHLRAETRRRAREEAWTRRRATWIDPRAEAERGEDAGWLRFHLARIPERDRGLVLASFATHERRRAAEAASGLSPAAARRRIASIIARLRRAARAGSA